jgi:hypothetical protein
MQPPCDELQSSQPTTLILWPFTVTLGGPSQPWQKSLLFPEEGEQYEPPKMKDGKLLERRDPVTFTKLF